MAETEQDKHVTEIAGQAESGYPKIIATDDEGVVDAVAE